jgi:dTDP-4-amino-4,6-dideoxygalactose transaminase
MICKHRNIFKTLREKNILVNLHYIPVYLHPYYESIGFEKGYCPNAEIFYKSAISIPIFPKLTQEDQAFVVKEIKSALFN